MDGRIKKFWVGITILLMAAALILCVFASWRGSLYIKPSGNPQYTVTRFFDALLGGRYSQAYACLSDYTTLGLENEPASEEARQIYQALKDSYRYELIGKCEEQQMEATQRVSLRYLNVRRVESEISKRVNTVLALLVAEKPRDEVYDENNQYLPELTDEVYLRALEQVLESPEFYYSTAEFDVELSYMNGEWLMKTNQALFNALMGGES